MRLSSQVKFFIIIKEISLRIKNKNFQKINGKELYKYLLDELKSENVFIDTDSKKILKIKNKDKLLKNFVIYEREKKFITLENSKNFKASPVLLMIENFIDNYCNNNDIVVCSHVTSPFIKKKTIYNAITFLNKGYDSVSSSTFNKEFGLLKKNNNYIKINFDKNIVKKTQDLDPIILLNGAFFIFRSKTFKKYKTRYSKKHFYYQIKYPESIDINYPEDLKMARIYAKN